jgi:molecular chaperone GrpE
MTEADRRSDTKANGDTSANGAEAGSTSTPGSAPGSGPARESAPPGSAPSPASEEKNEIAKLRDQYLRTAADFENYRKRTRREVDDAQRRGRESALKDLLPVFDNLERAAAHAANAADAKSVVDGLRIVMKQWESTLEKMGVKRVATVGTPFDPAIHEAIQHLESPDHPAGVVLAEVQPGYSMGDYLVRAAMVVVSKGPPSGSAAAS